MAIALALDLFQHGLPPAIRPYLQPILYTLAALLTLTIIKLYSSGRANQAERPLHGKVVLITGGTSGIGQAVAKDLAARGAQLVLLTSTPGDDPFLYEYIQDLRTSTNNQLIYSEQVDLRSLHSIRKFATKWIDNAPPRRLDMIILCAATLTPPGGKRKLTEEGIEETWMVNYLANFHLLGILSPALRAQPFDRDVRVIMTTCSSYIGSPSLKDSFDKQNWSPGAAYARSKLALNIFGKAFQKHLDAYKRPDGLPMNTRVIFVDPGYARTPGTRRWLTRGSLTGLFLYVTTYFLPWLLLKSPYMAAQSILAACMDSSFGRGEGGKFVKECMLMDFARKEVGDEEVAKKLWEESDALIEKTEKVEARKRAVKKKEEELDERQKKEAEGLMEGAKRAKKEAEDKKKEKKEKKSDKKEEKDEKEGGKKKKGKKSR